MAELQQQENAKDFNELSKKFLQLQNEFKNLQARHTALFKLNQLSHECERIDVFYRQLHQTIASLLPANNFYIVLYDQTFKTLNFVYHVDEKDIMPPGDIPYERLKGSLTHRVIESAQPLLIASQNEEEELIGHRGVDWLGVPLLNNGFVIGVMAIQSYDESTRYQQDDLELLSFAAQHIVLAMTRLQDHERLQTAVNARTAELMQQIREREKSELLQESLFHISELSNKADLDIEKFYKQVHNIVGQLLNAENFYIAKYDERSQRLDFVYYQDQDTETEAHEYRSRVKGKKLTELVIQRGETLLLDQEQMQTFYQQGLTAKPAKNTQSWLGVPLKSGHEIMGAMVVQSYHKGKAYSQQDAEILNYVSQHVSTAIKRREMAEYERRSHELLEQQVKLRTAALEAEIKQRMLVEEQLKHSASHDALTGLANRSVFIDLVNHAIAVKKRHDDYNFAILFLDLDRFKVVNDSLGHHAGDSLLKKVASELKNIVREMDTVARIGGDEFVILLEEISCEAVVLDIAERITSLLSSPFVLNQQPVFIGTSIGIVYSDKHYQDATTMLRDADTAMYQAKSNGKGRFEIFDESMRNQVQNALNLEADIRDAIDNNEFQPFFQPIINLANQQVVGFEALARWYSEKRGFVMPNEFIPLAEETNLVMAIDLQILEKSCQQLKHWLQKYPDSNLYISCNLFCQHFFNQHLAQDIADILHRVGLSPHHLRLELTERALLEHVEIVQSNMTALKQLGVKILLDDFGTGYSSLSYLHRFPIDVLKIDRSFIINMQQDANHRAIIKTIIDLAKNLNMDTVGEGIENAEDAQLLYQMDCHYGQGYYFAKPLAADAALDFLNVNLSEGS